MLLGKHLLLWHVFCSIEYPSFLSNIAVGYLECEVMVQAPKAYYFTIFKNTRLRKNKNKTESSQSRRSELA